MSIGYKTFRVEQHFGLALDRAVEEANQWLKANPGKRVVNIETLFSARGNISNDITTATGVRVWFVEE